MAHLFQVGAGSGGMPVLDMLSRDRRITRVTLIEPDVYKPHNVERHLFPLAAVGRRYRIEGWNCWKRRHTARDHGGLLAVFDGGDIEGFLATAVRARLTILLCGATGSGKSVVLRLLAGSGRRNLRLDGFLGAGALQTAGGERLIRRRMDHLLGVTYAYQPQRLAFRQFKVRAGAEHLALHFQPLAGAQLELHFAFGSQVRYLRLGPLLGERLQRQLQHVIRHDSSLFPRKQSQVGPAVGA